MPPGHPHTRTLGSHLLSCFLQNHINPALDFTQTPPGMLALDNMLYLAKVHQDTYIRVRPGQPLTPGAHPCLPPLTPHVLSACSSCWRTVAGRTNTSVRSAAVPLSSPRCSVRSCRLESSVSLHSQMSGGTGGPQAGDTCPYSLHGLTSQSTYPVRGELVIRGAPKAPQCRV